MPISIPQKLERSVGTSDAGRRWLRQLPTLIERYATSWELKLGRPFSDDLHASWVAPCKHPEGDAVFKIGFPHFEAECEIDGLRVWGGSCAVNIYQSDKANHALLIERCVPGTTLRQAPDEVQDKVITQLLRELWDVEVPGHINTLETMLERWCVAAEHRYARQASQFEGERSLIAEGVAQLRQLSSESAPNTLLVTDLHAGNVLRSTRRQWLMIDPKPHVGDRNYDLTQHLFNHRARLLDNGASLIADLANRANADAERVLRWSFGRACLDAENLPIAQSLRPFL